MYIAKAERRSAGDRASFDPLTGYHARRQKGSPKYEVWTVKCRTYALLQKGETEQDDGKQGERNA